jgi:hypothetical protein
LETILSPADAVVKIVSRKLYQPFDIMEKTERGSAMSPSSAKQTETTIAEIMSLLGKVSEKFEPDNLGMKQWMIQNF